MAANRGAQIKQEDLFSNDALDFAKKYKANVLEMIDVNEKLVESAKKYAELSKNFSKIDNQKQMIANKQAESLENQKAINLIKQMEAAEISLAKIERQNAITRSQAANLSKREQLEAQVVANRLQNAQKKSITLTVEEKVRQQELNREKTLSAKANGALISAYESLNAKRTVAKNTLRDLIANEKSSVVEIKKAQKEYDTLDKKVRKADKAVGDFSKNVGNYKSAFGSLTGFASNLMGAFGVVGGLTLFATLVRDIYATTKEMQSLENALRQVTDTNANFIEQQLFLTRISEAYGVELKGLTQQFTQFYVSAKDKLASSEIQAIFESVTKAGASMGLSVQSQERAFLALNQMMSKGTIQAEELRGQLGEALPGALGIMAKAVGVTENQLGEMMKKGELLASDVLPKFAKQLELTYGIENKTRIDSLAAAQARFSNSWTELIVSIDSGGGRFSNFLIKSLDILNAMVETMTRFNETYAGARDKAAGASQKADTEIYKGLSPERTKAIAEQNKKIAQDSIDYLNNQLKTSKSFLEKLDEISLLNLTRMGKIPKVRKEIEDYNIQLGVQRGRVLAANEALNALLKTKKEEASIEESAKDKAKRLKAEKDALAELMKRMRERYELQKKLENDAYELSQFRFQREIDGYKQLVDNEKTGLSDRLDFNDKANEVFEEKNRETLEKQLRDLGVYNEKRGVFIRELSDKEIESIVAGGERIKTLTSEQTLIYEQYQALLTDAAKAGAEKRTQIIDSEYASNKKYIEELLQEFQNTANDDTTTENNRYKAELDAAKGNFDLIEQARENHEKRIIDIQRKYLSESLGFQIKALEDIIYIDSQRPENERISTEIMKGYVADLARFRKEQSELSVDVEYENLSKYREGYLEHVQKIKELASDLANALLGLTDAIFENNINKIDEDISANEEYYNRQLELAGNDQAQKDLITQESEKKRKKLEDEKRKEQHKQAIFNKAMQATQIAIATIGAVMTALRDVPKVDYGISAGIIAAGYAVVGAAQLAAVLATPIPKYRMGRDGGRAEWAEVGDGYVREVVENPDGSTYITPDKPTLTYLQENAKVHSSVEAYKKSQMDQYKTKTNNQSLPPSKKDYSKELLEETKLLRSQIAKNKGNVIVNLHGYSDEHLAWKHRNRNW